MAGSVVWGKEQGEVIGSRYAHCSEMYIQGSCWYAGYVCAGMMPVASCNVINHTSMYGNFQ